jgi:NADPH:quinone reductase
MPTLENMKAIQINGTQGTKSLRLVEVERPAPGANQVLIQVKATGLNYAELEQTRGRYPLYKKLPFVMGFEAAGVVVEVGSQVRTVKVGDRITTVVSSGGFAEFAVADAGLALPIPDDVSFAEATTLTIQGVSAYAILKLAAQPKPSDRVLIQAAAGGVGLFLVQLAKLFRVKQLITLASNEEKLDVLRSLGADIAINYSEGNWVDQVTEATGGRGVDLLLQSVSGDIADQSLGLVADFGRTVVFGASNVYDTILPERVQQLIHKNQSLTGFNLPTIPVEQIGPCVGEFLQLVQQRKLRLFANTQFPLEQFVEAFDALSSRQIIGKVVLLP